MANEVGTITVRGDTRGIEKVTTKLRQMVRGSERAQRSASKLGSVVGRLAAGLSVGLLGRAFLAKTEAQEKAVARLNATLKATGRFSEGTSEQLQRQAAALQSLTTFGDEAIIGAQGLITTFKNIGGDVFPRVTKAVLDMSEVMDQDLKSTVVQVGKALNDPITGLTALSRVGVTFTEQQKDVIKSLAETGRVAEAQAMILDELESEFGGAAEAARNTFSGALDAVGNAFSDLLEGRSGDAGMRGATAALNDLEKTLQSPAIKEGFANLTGAIATTVGWLAKGAGAFAEFGTSIGEFFARLGSGPTGSLEAIDARIEELRYNLSLPVAGGFFKSIADALGYDIEEARRKAEEELRKLEDLRTYFEEPADPNQAARDIANAPVDLGQPEIEPITLDVESTRKKIAKLQADLTRDLRKAGEEAGRALAESVEETTAELGGPAAEANLRYRQTLEEIDAWEKTLIGTKQISAEQQEQLNQARANAAELHAQEIEQIEALAEAERNRLTPAQELIAALQFENELLKASEKDREKMIALRYAGADATVAQREEIERLIEAQQQEREAIEAMDEFRGAVRDLVVDFGDGVGSMGDAFDKFAQRIRQRALELAAEKLIEKIFGAFGTAGGGGGGGGFDWGSVIGSFFGGGRQGGGTVYPGRLHPVMESGQPELLSVNRRNYLLAPQEGGTIQPIRETSTTNNRNLTVNITVPETTPRRTIDQAAKTFGEVQRRAEARNG
jgi:hypothetical protein